MFTALVSSPAALAATHAWHGGFVPFPFLFPVFFLVVFVVLFLVFGVFRRGHWRALSDARGVLADRFARGEIDAVEYRSRLSELTRK